MATRSNNFVTRFKGEDRSLQRAFGRTTKGFGSLKKGAAIVGKSVAGVGVAAGVAAAGIALMGRRFAGQVDELAKSAGKYQLLISETQALSQASKLSGTTLEVAGKALERFAKATGEAGQGLSSPIRAFDDAGISFGKMAHALKSDRLAAFESALSIVAKMEDPAKQAAVASQLFGRQWGILVAAIKKDPTIFTDRKQMIDRLGLAISQDMGRSVELMQDNFSEMGIRLETFGQQITSLLSGPIAGFTQGFTQAIDDWAMGLGGYDKAAAMVAKNITGYFNNALASIAPTIDAINSVAKLVNTVGDAHAGAVDTVSTVMQSMAGAIPGTIASSVAQPGDMGSPTLRENERQTQLLQDMRDQIVRSDGLVFN